jgi:membrane protease YdiL (CAAX protease family)
MLLRAGVELSLGAPPGPLPAPALTAAEPALRQAVTYLGAGIYEEALFRLILFSVLVRLFAAADLARGPAVLLAAAGSAALFSTAHHVGPYGQPYSNYLFVFRLVAGLYFALLYQLRGFGVAVGAHACYNVMVSVA